MDAIVEASTLLYGPSPTNQGIERAHSIVEQLKTCVLQPFPTRQFYKLIPSPRHPNACAFAVEALQSPVLDASAKFLSVSLVECSVTDATSLESLLQTHSLLSSLHTTRKSITHAMSLVRLQCSLPCLQACAIIVVK